MDKPLIDLITQLIGSLGFPVFVSVWLLWRYDSLLRELTQAIKDLKHTLESRAINRKE